MATTGEAAVRVCLHTLGCPKNEADSRVVLRLLATRGPEIVDDPAEATHILVNTCGFIQDAKEESIEAILSLCADHPASRIVVMGCLVERYREELAAGIPEVDSWHGVATPEVVEQVVQAIVGGGRVTRAGMGRSVGETKPYAYVKISDGCDESCTFCAIPAIKGRYQSLSADGVLQEADACLQQGARELVLVGQDTTRWRSGALDLLGLVRLLSEDDRTRWIRVMYLQPSRVNDEFLMFMKSQKKLCEYLDIPFQHSHPEILRKMGRRGGGTSYLDLLKKARAAMPEIAVRSTFIVGFPGEREAHFDHLASFVETAGFDYGGAFIYSPEEGTSAADMRPRVRRVVSQARLNVLNELLLQGGVRRRERLVGRTVEVMIDSVGRDDGMEDAEAVGRTAGQAPEVDGVTYLQGHGCGALTPGDLVDVRITDVVGCDLVGEVCAS